VRHRLVLPVADVDSRHGTSAPSPAPPASSRATSGLSTRAPGGARHRSPDQEQVALWIHADDLQVLHGHARVSHGTWALMPGKTGTGTRTRRSIPAPCEHRAVAQGATAEVVAAHDALGTPCPSRCRRRPPCPRPEDVHEDAVTRASARIPARAGNFAKRAPSAEPRLLVVARDGLLARFAARGSTSRVAPPRNRPCPPSYAGRRRNGPASRIVTGVAVPSSRYTGSSQLSADHPSTSFILVGTRVRPRRFRTPPRPRGRAARTLDCDGPNALISTSTPRGDPAS